MTAPTPGMNDTVTPGVRAFYENWLALMRAEADATDLPTWEQLDGRAYGKWMQAYAATVQVTAAMADAINATMGDISDLPTLP